MTTGSGAAGWTGSYRSRNKRSGRVAVYVPDHGNIVSGGDGADSGGDVQHGPAGAAARSFGTGRRRSDHGVAGDQFRIRRRAGRTFSDRQRRGGAAVADERLRFSGGVSWILDGPVKTPGAGARRIRSRSPWIRGRWERKTGIFSVRGHNDAGRGIRSRSTPDGETWWGAVAGGRRRFRWRVKSGARRWVDRGRHRRSVSGSVARAAATGRPDEDVPRDQRPATRRWTVRRGFRRRGGFTVDRPAWSGRSRRGRRKSFTIRMEHGDGWQQGAGGCRFQHERRERESVLIFRDQRGG